MIEKRELRTTRGSWGGIRPVQKPHSTPKGKRGYMREKNESTRKEAVDEDLDVTSPSESWKPPGDTTY